MDVETEEAFLLILEEVKDAINSKDHTKNGKERRKAAWDKCQRQLLLRVGKDFTVSKLQKKWNNLQCRLKDRMKDGKRTGGGAAKALSKNDRLTWRIIGESNPKITMIPGAMVNAEDIENVRPTFQSEATMKSFSDSNDLSDDELAAGTNVAAGSSFTTVSANVTKKRKKKADENLDALHREVLELQKEKLLLNIKTLRKQVATVSDASTQTDFLNNAQPYSFLNDLIAN